MRYFLPFVLLAYSVASAQQPATQPLPTDLVIETPPAQTPQPVAQPAPNVGDIFDKGSATKEAADRAAFKVNEEKAFTRTEQYRAAVQELLARLKYGISFNQSSEAVGKMEAAYDAAEPKDGFVAADKGELAAVQRWKGPMDSLLTMQKVWEREIACNNWAADDRVPLAVRDSMKDAAESLEEYRVRLVFDAKNDVDMLLLVHENQNPAPPLFGGTEK
jgi:hypothetical protein